MIGQTLKLINWSNRISILRNFSEKVENEWIQVIERHRAAVALYFQLAGTIPENTWLTPIEAEKWTPAQITHHLILTYQVFLKQIRGEQNIKTVYSPFVRWLLRLFILPQIYRRRKLPRGAQAPKEILPIDADKKCEVALEELEKAVGEFENEASERRNEENLRLTHHVFGKIKLIEGIELAAIYMEHHARQLPH